MFNLKCLVCWRLLCCVFRLRPVVPGHSLVSAWLAQRLLFLRGNGHVDSESHDVWGVDSWPPAIQWDQGGRWGTHAQGRWTMTVCVRERDVIFKLEKKKFSVASVSMPAVVAHYLQLMPTTCSVISGLQRIRLWNFDLLGTTCALQESTVSNGLDFISNLIMSFFYILFDLVAVGTSARWVYLLDAEPAAL